MFSNTYFFVSAWLLFLSAWLLLHVCFAWCSRLRYRVVSEWCFRHIILCPRGCKYMVVMWSTYVVRKCFQFLDAFVAWKAVIVAIKVANNISWLLWGMLCFCAGLWICLTICPVGVCIHTCDNFVSVLFCLRLLSVKAALVSSFTGSPTLECFGFGLDAVNVFWDGDIVIIWRIQ